MTARENVLLNKGFIASKTNSLFSILMIFISLFSIFFCREESRTVIISWWILIISLVNLIRSLRNWKCFIIYGFIAYANYSICIPNHIFPITDSFFTSWRNDAVAIYGLIIIYTFMAVLTLLYPPNNEIKTESFFCNNPDNFLISIGCCIILLLIFIFGYTRPEESGTRGDPSTLYEYSIIILIIAFYYSNSSVLKIILSIICFAFVLTNLIYGGRVTAIQLIICWFLMFFADKVTITKSIPFIIIGLAIFTSIGNNRADGAFSAKAIYESFKGLSENKLCFDTAYSAYFTSLTFVKVYRQIGFQQRMYMFFKWFISIFLGGSVTDSNLAVYTRSYYVHYYGGVLPFFGFFYFGYAGIAFIAAYVSSLIRKLACIRDSQKGGLNKCLKIYFVSTVPRWYLYSPSPLFRGILLLCLVYGMCYLFNNSFMKNGSKSI